jgi:hypothetical protein
MPIKFGLVLINRLSQQNNNNKTQHSNSTPQIMNKQSNISQQLNVAQQSKDINLRRIMGAPKTSCNSCRG